MRGQGIKGLGFLKALSKKGQPMKAPRQAVAVLGLAVASAVVVGLFLFQGLDLLQAPVGSPEFAERWSLAAEYVLPRRAVKVAAMAVVAAAVGISTLLFQTVTANRILTPSIMGLDALYVLLQTGLVFWLGAQGWLMFDPLLKFGLEAVLMVLFSLALYGLLFSGRGTGLHQILLVGIVLGTLFRGLAGLLQRLLDPNQYLILQDLFFASFNQVPVELLGVSAAVVGACAAWAWSQRRTLDVLALGRDTAVSLGVPHRRVLITVLIISSVLVAVSAALVGPATFFGLLVVSLAYQFCRRFSHAWLLPIVTLVGVVTLVGGQWALERVLGFTTPLSVVIEFAGGILFLVLLLKGSLR